jgi:hypothetical protein
MLLETKGENMEIIRYDDNVDNFTLLLEKASNEKLIEN